MEGFTDKNAADNLAVHDDEKKWLCGREGPKKDGTPSFICSARLPMDYWRLLDENGDWVQSAFTEEELTPKEGQVVVKHRWKGCSHFFDPKTGQRRNSA